MLIDFCAHILPGADNGCRDSYECRDQMRLLCGEGIRLAVMTPIFDAEKTDIASFAERRRRCFERFDDIYESGFPRVYLGSEILISEKLNTLPGLSELAIIGTRTLFVSMPKTEWDSRLLDTLCGLQDAGFDVVVGHLQRHPENYAETVFNLGFKGQIDVSAFVGLRGLTKRKKYFEWIDNDLICALGSDIYGTDDSYRDAIRAECRIMDEPRATKIVRATARLLTGAYSYPINA